MYKIFSFKNTTAATAGLLLAAITSFVWADAYYRWHDEAGGVHYGSTPPQGVDAEKVKVHTGKGTPANSSAPDNTLDETQVAETPEEAAQKRKLQQAQREECDAERKRLRLLKANKPIRMAQADGTSKYLDKKEIAQEIERSNQYIKDVCP